MVKGLFISFEGGEGSGKSSLIENLAQFLAEEKISFLKTREPGGTALGEKVRQLLLHESAMSPYTELAFFLASRAEHVDKILLPALSEGKIVLCDRFNDTTLAYQGAARNLEMDRVKKLCAFFAQNLQPDTTFYLDIDPKLGLKRASHKGSDRLEKEALFFHETVRTAYLELVKNERERFFLIDATLSKEKVFALALAHLRQKHAF
ncbi:MAG: dTMP kinase [Parachlamydiales bacterium]|jgi:dTMP kinase